MSEDKKQCVKCNEWKAIDAFYVQRRWCKQCVIAKNTAKKKTWAARAENKERRKAYDRDYRNQPKNKKQKRLLAKKRGPAPYDKLQNIIKRHNYQARKAGLPYTLTTEQWQHALNYFNGCCAVCERQLNDMFGEFTKSADHWIPLSYEGGDNPGTVAENIIPLCHGVDGCNNSKGATLPMEWLQQKFSRYKSKKIIDKIQKYFDSLS